MKTRKVSAPEKISLPKLLKGIRDGVYYFRDLDDRFGFEYVYANVNTIPEIDVYDPFRVQRVTLGGGKRGNIKPYAGGTYDAIVATARYRGGPAIHLYLRKV